MQNHGVPKEVTEELFHQSKVFFDQPEDVKLQTEVSLELAIFLQFLLLRRSSQRFYEVILQAIGNRGYTGLGEQMLDSSGKQKKGDTKESYYICSRLLTLLRHLKIPPMDALDVTYIDRAHNCS